MTGQEVHETPKGCTVFPQGVAHPRGLSTEWRVLITCLSIFFSIISIYLTGVSQIHFYLFSFISGGFVAGELGTRFVYLILEMEHINGRYNGKTFLLFKQLFEFTALSKVFLTIVILSFMFQGRMGHVHDLDECWKMPPMVLLLVVAVVYLIGKFIALDRNPVHNSIVLESLQPLDYGSGMAENFFYGYLRLCLPDTGDKEKGIRERINDFIAQQHLDDEDFPVKKLFILIPVSTYIPNNLEEHAGDSMKHAQSLEKQVKNRAGVIDRIYKNSVYRIQEPEDERPLYVAVEGATPCKTLQEVIQFSGMKQAFYKAHQKDIVLMFYRRLQEILNEHENCRDLCELIYYVDTDERGRSSVNIASLIKKRVREVQERDAHFEFMRRQVN